MRLRAGSRKGGEKTSVETVEGNSPRFPRPPNFFQKSRRRTRLNNHFRDSFMPGRLGEGLRRFHRLGEDHGGLAARAGLHYFQEREQGVAAIIARAGQREHFGIAGQGPPLGKVAQPAAPRPAPAQAHGGPSPFRVGAQNVLFPSVGFSAS